MLLSWLIPSSALAWEDGLCVDWTSQSSQEMLSWMMTAEGTPQSSTSPCTGAQFISPAYNCSAYVPVEQEAQKLGQRQARDVVLTALYGIYGKEQGDSQAESLRASLRQGGSGVWLEEMAAGLVAVDSTFPRRAVCLPRVDGEQCESAPPMAVVVSAGSSSPADRVSREFEVPWRPGENELMQPALAKLRVGPSDEYRRLPEQPPPV